MQSKMGKKEKNGLVVIKQSKSDKRKKIILLPNYYKKDNKDRWFTDFFEKVSDNEAEEILKIMGEICEEKGTGMMNYSCIIKKYEMQNQKRLDIRKLKSILEHLSTIKG